MAKWLNLFFKRSRNFSCEIIKLLLLKGIYQTFNLQKEEVSEIKNFFS